MSIFVEYTGAFSADAGSSTVINIVNMDKNTRYQEVYRQIEAIVGDESDLIANMANMAALLREAFGFWWTGFYIVKEGQLVLGPFQGPAACTRIPFGKGVCGSAWERKESIIVPDVDLFPGHIACSSLSRSEIVIPLFKGGEIFGVLDIDSREPAYFDETDKEWLEKTARLI